MTWCGWMGEHDAPNSVRVTEAVQYRLPGVWCDWMEPEHDE